eukprot:COSAG04_NODE_13166_length_617_cov_1.204633_1_plen_168_part_10
MGRSSGQRQQQGTARSPGAIGAIIPQAGRPVATAAMASRNVSTFTSSPINADSRKTSRTTRFRWPLHMPPVENRPKNAVPHVLRNFLSLSGPSSLKSLPSGCRKPLIAAPTSILAELFTTKRHSPASGQRRVQNSAQWSLGQVLRSDCRARAVARICRGSAYRWRASP